MLTLSPFLLLTLFGFAFVFLRMMPFFKVQQNLLFGVFNVAFLAAVMPPVSLGYTIGFLLIGYGLIVLKARLKGRGFAALLLALLTVFVLFKNMNLSRHCCRHSRPFTIKFRFYWASATSSFVW